MVDVAGVEPACFITYI